jgi:maleylacetoacetate isomerase
LAKNPAGFVPTLEVDGIKLTESCAIIEWLEETHPAPALLPKDPLARAQVRQLAYTVAMGIQPIQNLRVQKYVSDEQAGRKKFAAHWIRTGFKVYEKLLARGNPGAFSFGDEVTLADLCLIPQVYNANRFEVDMGEFPLISGINGRALDTEPCQRAAPENQPGAND